MHIPPTPNPRAWDSQRKPHFAPRITPPNWPAEARAFAWRTLGCMLALAVVCGLLAAADALIQAVQP